MSKNYHNNYLSAFTSTASIVYEIDLTTDEILDDLITKDGFNISKIYNLPPKCSLELLNERLTEGVTKTGFLDAKNDLPTSKDLIESFKNGKPLVEIYLNFDHSPVMIKRTFAMYEDDDTHHIMAIAMNHEVTRNDYTESESLEKEKKILQQNIEFQNQYYKQILDMESCGVLAYSIPYYKLVHINKEALRFLNVENSYQASLNLYDIVTGFTYPDPTTLDKLKNIRNGSNELEYECIINKGKPTERHALAKTRVFSDPNGNKTVVTTFIDISTMNILRNALDDAKELAEVRSKNLQELERIKKQLEESLDIITNAGYGIWKIGINPNGDYTMYINDTLAEIFGVKNKRMTPEELYVYYHKRLGKDLTADVVEDYEAMTKGEIKTRFLPWHHPTKGIIYLRAGGTRHTVENGIDIISGYCADVTQQKTELEELNSKLNEALRKANEASLAKTNFLSSMSHDIRTPMNAILGYIELLERNIDNKYQIENYLTKMKQSGSFLLSIINNVLEMAKIESGHADLYVTLNNIPTIFKNIFSVFEPDLKTKNITFNLTKNYTHKDIYCDETKISEIYLNIISNSIKYTPNGGRLDVDFVEIPAHKDGYARFRTVIKDTGIGMSKEFLPHIFEPFVREFSSTKSRIRGTGLGMPIVKQYVDLMDGSIEVESEIGEGTTFILELEHKICKDCKKVNKEEISSSLKGKRVLLVEDNELNAEIASELLKAEGLKVETAVDGAFCVDMIKSMPSGYYDFILMDIQMPILDGYQTTKIIRNLADDKKRNIPIIAMTANAFEEDKQRALASGMNGHIGKPFDFDKLTQTIMEILY